MITVRDYHVSRALGNYLPEEDRGPVCFEYTEPVNRVAFIANLSLSPLDILLNSMSTLGQWSDLVQNATDRLRDGSLGAGKVGIVQVDDSASTLLLSLAVDTIGCVNATALTSSVTRTETCFVACLCSLVQEFVAASLGLEVGTLYHLAPYYLRSDDDVEQYFAFGSAWGCRIPVVDSDPEWFLSDLAMYCDVGPLAVGYETRFFRRVVLPIRFARDTLRESGNIRECLEHTSRCEDEQWRKACEVWLEMKAEQSGST